MVPTAPQAIPLKASAAEVVAVPRWLMPAPASRSEVAFAQKWANATAPAGPEICEDLSVASPSDAMLAEKWANATPPKRASLLTAARPAHFHGTSTEPQAALFQDSVYDDTWYASLSTEGWLHQIAETVLTLLPCAVAADATLLLLLPLLALMLRPCTSRQASEQKEDREESEESEEHAANPPPFRTVADTRPLGCGSELAPAAASENTAGVAVKAGSSLGLERLPTPCRTTARSTSHPCMVAEVSAAAAAL